MRIAGKHATKEHRQRLCWTSLGGEIDELKDFIVATFQCSQRLDASKQCVNICIGELIGSMPYLGSNAQKLRPLTRRSPDQSMA